MLGDCRVCSLFCVEAGLTLRRGEVVVADPRGIGPLAVRRGEVVVAGHHGLCPLLPAAP